MYLKIKFKSKGERLTVVCEEEPKTIFVRGHFRVINGKKVYVKAVCFAADGSRYVCMALSGLDW